jgi:hypothetical protein
MLRVRRDPSISREEGWRIAVLALTRLNTRYDFAKIMGLKSQSKEGFSWTRPARKPDAEYCICSELYSDAYTCVTGKALWNLVGQEVTPAFLSQTSMLEDVRISWQRIP